MNDFATYMDCDFRYLRRFGINEYREIVSIQDSIDFWFRSESVGTSSIIKFQSRIKIIYIYYYLIIMFRFIISDKIHV